MASSVIEVPPIAVPVIVALVHELLNEGTWASPGDLAEAVKWRCANRRVRYDGGTVSEAIRRVQYARPIWGRA